MFTQILSLSEISIPHISHHVVHRIPIEECVIYFVDSVDTLDMKCCSSMADMGRCFQCESLARAGPGRAGLGSAKTRALAGFETKTWCGRVAAQHSRLSYAKYHSSIRFSFVPKSFSPEDFWVQAKE